MWFGYYFYYLYIYIYLIKCNVSFLYISEYPYEFIKCNVSFLSISEHSHELHDLHKDYPLAPEHLQREKNILSDYQHHLLQDEEFSKPPPKLISNLRYKTNYIIHYRNWKFYLELGLCLTNVHVFSFDQLPWLENYINLTLVNVQLWKMILQKISLNNAVFGKSFTCLFVLLWPYILIHSLYVKFSSSY